jgi:hypothetical protein
VPRVEIGAIIKIWEALYAGFLKMMYKLANTSFFTTSAKQRGSY